MADRVSAAITLGGTITPFTYAELAEVIVTEGLSTEWDGEPLRPDQRIAGESLRLFAHEVACGRFEALEAWCVEHRMPFARWSGAYGGEWGAERVVFPGVGEPISYTADEDDRVLIDRDTAERLDSIEAIRAHFDAADIVVPPLVVEAEWTCPGKVERHWLSPQLVVQICWG